MASLHALLARAVDLATESVAAGGGPFGAVLAVPDEHDGTWRAVAEGVNRVVPDLDPTAHAEVVALRRAARALDRFELGGAVLLSSCEPCPMCLTASLWARVDAVWFAATRDDAADAGFDDRVFYDVFHTPREQWQVPVQQLDLPAPTRPFDAWRGLTHRVPY